MQAISVRLAFSALSAAVLLVAGCAYNKPKEVVQECTFPDNPKQAAPVWVCGVPPEGAALTAVGSHPKSGAGYSFMTDQAQADGRVKLAFALRASVQAMIDRYAATTGAGPTETVDLVNKTVSRQTTDNVLQGTRMVKTAMSERGDLYVLMSLNPQQMNAAVTETLKTSMGNAPAVYQKLEAAKAQKEMSAALGSGNGTRAVRSQDAVISDIMRVGSQ